jgi:hypothetical protein
MLEPRKDIEFIENSDIAPGDGFFVKGVVEADDANGLLFFDSHQII